jgi:hypothetical protein
VTLLYETCSYLRRSDWYKSAIEAVLCAYRYIEFRVKNPDTGITVCWCSYRTTRDFMPYHIFCANWR